MTLKKAISLFLCAVLLSALAMPVPAAAYYEGSIYHFDSQSVTYSRGQFGDVDEGAWYGLDGQGVIATACGLGLMDGVTGGFAPNDSLTIAQAVTLAARLCSIYFGDGHVFVQGDPWYQCYVDYAELTGILREGDYLGMMDDTATRAEMAYIFYNALPDTELYAINDVRSLPDVDENNVYCEKIFCLYNAGILTGNDEYGSFVPDSAITRAAAAAIVSRMALPELRERFTLAERQTDAGSAALLDYSHYDVSRPERINTYDDFVQAWEWMLVNSVFEDGFASDIVCDESDISYYQTAALEAFNLVATMEYFDYASFRRTVSIYTSYTCSYSGECSGLIFSMSLNNADGIPDSTIRSNVEDFENACAGIVTSLYDSGKLTTKMNDLEKAYVLYEYVAKNTAYDLSYTKYTAYDAAVGRLAVCQGYAGMYSYICNLAGVPMRAVTGNVDGESHAWNVFMYNGEPHYVDTTFADPTPDVPGYCDYNWFDLSEDELRASRTFNTDKLKYAGTFSDGVVEIAA